MRDKSRGRARKKRHTRIRLRLRGTAERPRLNVFRSLRHMHAQIVNDATGHTIVAACTLDAEVRQQLDGLNKTGQAKIVGEVLARRALAKGVRQVVFDRGGYKYHGRVKALAEAARGEGLQF